MPSYMSTPLFSIQEVASSTVSIPKKAEIYQDNEENEVMNSEDIEQFKDFLYEYKISETNYYQELTSLLELVNSFDPVYNNYFDDSLDDITDELISSRKRQNLNLIKLVRTLLFKHCELIKLLSIEKLDLLIIKVSEWGLSISNVYLDFVNLYRLDINQSNFEIKLFRRPLIRIRYLNNFFLNLRKNYFNTFKVEKFFTKELLSNFEVINFKLKNCLKLARMKDENEKIRCESNVNISDVKDIISLNKISVNPNFSKNFENFFNCELYYNNNFEKRSINLKNIQFIFSEHSKINQVGILEIENFGKKLLFQPLKQNEFKFNKKIKKNFLSFSHAIHNHKIEFFVKLKDDNSDNEKFEKKLLELFPNEDANRTSDEEDDINIEKFDKPSFGLKVRSEKSNNDNESDDNQRSQKAIPLYKLGFTSNSAPILSTGLSKYLDNENQSENKRKSSMIDLRITKKELISESKQQKQKINIRREQLSQKILQDVIDDINSSDEENFTDKENNETNKVISSPSSLAKDSTLPSPVPSPELASKLTPTNAIHNQQKFYNFEKYQNSFSNSSLNLAAKPKKKRQSIFNMLSTILTKNNQQSNVSSTESLVNSNNNNNRNADNSSSHSNSIPESLLSKINDPKLSTYAELSNVRFSIWTSHNWTVPKSSTLRLIHSGSVIYLGFYNENQTNIINNKPMLLVQLNKQSTIRTTTLDIHLQTINYLNEKIMILIRTPNRHSLLRVKNAIYDPYGIESLSNSSSCRSDLSKISTVSRSTTVSNLSSNTTSKQNSYSNSNSTLKINKSWSGAANAFLIENKSKLKNLDRCVVNVSSLNNRIDVELIGYQFGTLEISVTGKNVRRMESLSIIIENNYNGDDNNNNNDSNNYLLSFDNEVDVNNFLEIIN